MDTAKKEIIASIKERFDENRCLMVERMLSIMSNPIRFHILCALMRDSFSVTELVELTDSKLSNISQQLKMMSLAGYIVKERRGKQSIYSLQDDRVRRLIETLEELFI